MARSLIGARPSKASVDRAEQQARESAQAYRSARKAFVALRRANPQRNSFGMRPCVVAHVADLAWAARERAAVDRLKANWLAQAYQA